jgi:hypothetical protein
MISKARPQAEEYEGYRGLPPLLGLHTMEEAARIGLSVSDSVDRIKRIHWALKRLHQIMVSRVASTPIYELKMAFSLHAYYCAEHITFLAQRVREMREPPHGLDECPHPRLSFVFEEIENSPDLDHLITGLYGMAFPAILEAIKRLKAETNRLLDHPTFRLCRFADLEIEEVVDYGKQALECLVTKGQPALIEWSRLLESGLASAGSLDGSQPIIDALCEPVFSGAAQPYDGRVRRDERFRDCYNMGVNAEAMLFDSTIEANPKRLMLYFKRMREIDVPELMSSILSEVKDKPWEYYKDLSRQMWDEARHAMMGELGFWSIGIDWTQIPFNFTWSMTLNTELTPIERHSVLYAIEQGLMPSKNGKKHEWQIAVASSSRLSALIQDFDWADEVVHARIGRQWLMPEFGSQPKIIAFGDQAWSKAVKHWSRWRDEGLTEHRNWWPELYSKACKNWGIEPDPKLLAYDKTYENARPDLKAVAG